MAWTYSDWPTLSTAAARLTRLNLHIQEVSDRVAEEVAGDGKSMSSNAIQNYLDTLMPQRKDLEKRVERAAGGLVSITKFRDPEDGG